MMGEVVQNQREHHMILTKYEAVYPTAVSDKTKVPKFQGDITF